ncbi:GTP cyclohydrolase 1 feedback regulatory protein-like, partial [Halichondria panicea]|uniref:GTP cyclohydrolase 1 feedback regulatory protein-like n=1 Tax=Halichondria panicea TaxID=6063 RepID=UPI00312BB3EB
FTTIIIPYILISTVVRLETGPTLCGDEESEKGLMTQLDAVLQLDSGRSFKAYISPLTPRQVLSRLASLDYRVVCSSGVGQTCIWTLFKDAI